MEASTSPTVRDEESAEPAGAEEVLAAAGLSASELSECVRVLWQIEQAQELGTLDPNASCLRSLRKVLSQLSKQTFAHLPQKSQLDENERKRAEKDRKRERRQRQLEAGALRPGRAPAYRIPGLPGKRRCKTCSLNEH